MPAARVAFFRFFAFFFRHSAGKKMQKIEKTPAPINSKSCGPRLLRASGNPSSAHAAVRDCFKRHHSVWCDPTLGINRSAPIGPFKGPCLRFFVIFGVNMAKNDAGNGMTPPTRRCAVLTHIFGDIWHQNKCLRVTTTQKRNHRIQPGCPGGRSPPGGGLGAELPASFSHFWCQKKCSRVTMPKKKFWTPSTRCQ